MWTLGGLVGAGTFAAVLWLTEPVRPLPAVAILAGLSVSDVATLMTAVQTAGLRGSSETRGAIDKIRRQDDGQVLVTGWVTDAASQGSPLTVMAFAGGKNALTTTTRGARPDMARALALSDAAAANMSFEGVVSCDKGAKLIVIAVTPKNMYSHFGFLVCP
jgi:hypothetical protein